MSRLNVAITTLFVCLFSLVGPSSLIAGMTSCDKDKPIVIGYSSEAFYNVDPNDALSLITTWAQTVDRKLKNEVGTRVIFMKNLDEMKKVLANNDVDIIALMPEEFISLRESVRLKPVLSSVLSSDYGKDSYNELLILVRNDRGISQVEQLRGKNIRVDSGQKGSIPMLWLNTLLKNKVSGDARNFFSKITEYPKASQVILPVFFDQADACVASRVSFETMVELNPQIGRNLHIIERSPGFLTGIIAVREDVSNPKRDAMVTALRNIHTDPKGRQLLTLFRINRLVDFKNEHLSSVEKMLNASKYSNKIVSRRKQGR